MRRLSDGALLHCVAAHREDVSALATNPGHLISSSVDGSVIVWTVPELRKVSESVRRGAVLGLSIAPSGGRLAIARARRGRNRPGLWVGSNSPSAIDVVTFPGQKPRAQCRGHRGAVLAVAWADDTLISSSSDKTLRFWSKQCRALNRIALESPVFDLRVIHHYVVATGWGLSSRAITTWMARFGL